MSLVLNRSRARIALFHPALLFALLMLLTLRAFAASVTLAWDPVTAAPVAGYKVYYGATAGSYTANSNMGNVTTGSVGNLTEGSTYHFVVTAYDSTGAESGYSNDVTATIPYSAPTANFTASGTSGVAPLALNFTSTSSGNITSYSWNFGDGSTSTSQNPSHVYSAAGSYTVALTVTGSGGSNTKSMPGYVNVTTAPTTGDTAPPTAPGSLAATANGTSGINLKWTASTDNVGVTGYRIERCQGAGCASFAQIATATSTSYADASLAAGTSYTYRVRATDAAGNLSAYSNVATAATSTASTPASTACPCSIWSSSAVPKVAADPDTNAVELGVKFKSDVAGYITGIRFYKSTTNTGTHTGSLWSASGKLLARATFSNETASGWQTVKFSTPVAITANAVYVASYHTNVGRYAGDTGYFSASGVDNGLLHALKNGVSGGNGVYRYGSTSGFPNQTWNASNYWVDVVFTTN